MAPEFYVASLSHQLVSQKTSTIHYISGSKDSGSRNFKTYRIGDKDFSLYNNGIFDPLCFIYINRIRGFDENTSKLRYIGSNFGNSHLDLDLHRNFRRSRPQSTTRKKKKPSIIYINENNLVSILLTIFNIPTRKPASCAIERINNIADCF